MNELRHGFVVTQQAPEVKLHYVEVNHHPRNPLVIFLHGFPDFWYSWRDYLPAMAREGYHAVAVDLRGYNESSRPLGIDSYHINRLVEDIRAVIRHFGSKQTFIV